MVRKKQVAWLGVVLFMPAPVLLAHWILRLPDEPLWDPVGAFTNLAFGLALAFSLPFPYLSAVIFLLILGWVGYGIGNRIGRLFRLS